MKMGLNSACVLTIIFFKKDYTSKHLSRSPFRAGGKMCLNIKPGINREHIYSKLESKY